MSSLFTLSVAGTSTVIAESGFLQCISSYIELIRHTAIVVLKRQSRLGNTYATEMENPKQTYFGGDPILDLNTSYTMLKTFHSLSSWMLENHLAVMTCNAFAGHGHDSRTDANFDQG